MTHRSTLPKARFASVLILSPALLMACASPGPTVLTSTPDEISIEFPIEGNLSEATKLAQKECEKNGRTARFTEVKTDATPTTRVAQFECVSPDVAAASEQSATPPAEAVTEAIAPVVPTTETPAADAVPAEPTETPAPSTAPATP